MQKLEQLSCNNDNKSENTITLNKTFCNTCKLNIRVNTSFNPHNKPESMQMDKLIVFFGKTIMSFVMYKLLAVGKISQIIEF